MKVGVDQTLCQGHGQCVDCAPEIFELRDDGLAYILRQPSTPEQVARVREAVTRCPTDAVQVSE